MKRHFIIQIDDLRARSRTHGRRRSDQAGDHAFCCCTVGAGARWPARRHAVIAPWASSICRRGASVRRWAARKAICGSSPRRKSQHFW